jgi:two-component system, LytTR family, sensor kinase
MMTDISKSYKSVSTLKITLLVVLAISIVMPVVFGYINDRLAGRSFLLELGFTPLRLAGITLLIYAIISLANKIIGTAKAAWIRYFVELPVIFYCTFLWLTFFIDFIETPLSGSPIYEGNSWEFRQHIALYMIAALFIYIFQSGLNIYKLAQQKAAEAEKLQREYAQVRLQALKNQVNPHFLFNSLSVLSSLVHVSAETSDKFIQQLSKAYRYILEQKDIEWVTLQSELEFLDAYFFLLQIRFDKKIKLTMEIARDAKEYKLPPLTLQLLIENAVKHNKMSNNEPLTISIISKGEYLVVSNTINKRDQHELSTGIGLENIQKRYAYITDKRIEVLERADEFVVRIPLIK